MKVRVDQKKGLWSHQEDQKLMAHVTSNGIRNWTQISKDAGLLRTGKSCRLRWMNYLRPDLKRGCFTIEEIQLILYHHQLLGNKWSTIASYLPGRTDNEIKNFWHTYIRKSFKSDNPGAKAAFSSSAKRPQQLEMNKQKRRLAKKSISQSYETKDSNTNTSITSDDVSSFDFPILESYVPNEGNSRCVMKDGNVGTNINLLSETNRDGEGNDNEEGWIDKSIFADLFPIDDEFMFGMNSSSMMSLGCNNLSSWENIHQNFNFPETSDARSNNLSTQNLN